MAALLELQLKLLEEQSRSSRLETDVKRLERQCRELSEQLADERAAHQRELTRMRELVMHNISVVYPEPQSTDIHSMPSPGESRDDCASLLATACDHAPSTANTDALLPAKPDLQPQVLLSPSGTCPQVSQETTNFLVETEEFDTDQRLGLPAERSDFPVMFAPRHPISTSAPRINLSSLQGEQCFGGTSDFDSTMRSESLQTSASPIASSPEHLGLRGCAQDRLLHDDARVQVDPVKPAAGGGCINGDLSDPLVPERSKVQVGTIRVIAAQPISRVVNVPVAVATVDVCPEDQHGHEMHAPRVPSLSSSLRSLPSSVETRQHSKNDQSGDMEELQMARLSERL